MKKISTMDINLANFTHNYNEIKEILKKDTEIMPILKDNAYKTYINTQIDLLNNLNVKIIGVANVDEGINMRKLGFAKDILILNQPFDYEISEIAKYNLTIGCGSTDYISKLKDFPANFNIHVEVCTGMGRTGIHTSKINDLISQIKNTQNINVTGIYTHFSCSESDNEYTLLQINSFNLVLEKVKSEFPSLQYIHACNSAGILNYPNAHFNLVRPGIILYGHYPAENLKGKICLKPVTKLKSKISFLKDVPSGTCISYGKTFVTERTSKIATVAMGYADGIHRILSNKGKVVINNQIAPIVGTICMDSFMVDVTDIDANINDDVYIWDNENITVEEIAELCDTINYEILVGISDKVYRNFYR